MRLTTELERAIEEGIPAYPDLARADFYDVELEDHWAYIHVYRTGPHCLFGCPFGHAVCISLKNAELCRRFTLRSVCDCR